MQNLDSLQQGIKAVIVGVSGEVLDKNLKHLANLGLVKGNEVEMDNKVSDLCLIKKENSVFGISKKLASKILVQVQA